MQVLNSICVENRKLISQLIFK